MHFRNALFALLCAILLGGIAAPAAAKTYIFKKSGLETPLRIPDTWSVEDVDKTGIEIQSEDEEIWLWIDAVDMKSLDAVMESYFEAFKRQEVELTGKPVETRVNIAGTDAVLLDIPAKLDGETAVVKIIFTDAKAGARKGISVGYLASADGDEEHGPMVKRIIEDALRP